MSFFVEAPSINSKQNYETNVIVWSAHCKTTTKKHKWFGDQTLWFVNSSRSTFWFRSTLPQTINIDFMKLWACAIMGGGHGEQALLALHGWKMISPTIQFHMWTRWVQYDFSHIINIQGSRFYLLQIGYTYYHFNICSSNSDLFYFIFSWNKFLVAFLEAFEFFRLNFFTKIHKIWKKNEENIF